MNLNEIFNELTKGKIGMTKFNNKTANRYKVEDGIMFFKGINRDDWERVIVTDSLLRRTDFEIYQEPQPKTLKEEINELFDKQMLPITREEIFEILRNHSKRIKEEIKKLAISTYAEERVNEIIDKKLIIRKTNRNPTILPSGGELRK